MPTRPHLTKRQLTKALRDQGFTVTDTTNGSRVLAPDGIGSGAFHPSMFDEGNWRSYSNMLSDLKGIGFNVKAAVEPKAVARAKANGNGHSNGAADVTDHVTPTVDLTEAQARADAADLHAQVSALAAGQRALYDLIVDEPGLFPRDYAERLHLDRSAVSSRAAALFRLELVESTGATKSVRYWPKGKAIGIPSPPVQPRTPRAGQVRTSQTTPVDPVVRFRKLTERAARIRQDQAEVLDAMVQAYTEQETELITLRRKTKKLEEILGRAVDSL